MIDSATASRRRPTATSAYKPFDTNHTDKVGDHEHVTREYRVDAHKRSNLSLRRTCKMPVFFHNSRVYDPHFITMAVKVFKVG